MKIPDTIIRFVHRQTDKRVLLNLQSAIEARLSELESEIEVEQKAGRTVIESHRAPGLTIQYEEILCGKNCRGCPHGPYYYGYFRQGGRLRSVYIGKKLSRAGEVARLNAGFNAVWQANRERFR